jgi:hypothetical protein
MSRGKSRVNRPPPDLEEERTPNLAGEVGNGNAGEARDSMEVGCKRQKVGILVPKHKTMPEQEPCDPTAATASTASTATDTVKEKWKGPGGSATPDVLEQGTGQDLGRDSEKAVSRGSWSPTKERAGDGQTHSSDRSRNGAHER